ncbi:MAG: transglutaminaseTgpA domain-containing protein [Planctomycetaceae bacterium]|jgi:transglutaminase-like putative cysteine protease|nr:transglutaminaseTgpA domain-containing protein [Planctomycetaceae bacterium]
MRLSYGIAITLGSMTCLSSFMLGLGQNESILPIFMFITAVISFYLTDYRRIIRLGDWTVNVLVLIIVFCTFGEIIHNWGEDLAFSIARVLVFVEMVLLFREKETRFCWQILLISLLQVVVATVMQQSILFVFLLIVYVFIGLCAFVMIFLQKENRYFRSHSFVETFFDSLRAEIAERQDHGKLARIALVTLITGPLSFVFSFSNTHSTPIPAGSKDGEDRKLSSHEVLRSLFAVFPPEQDSNRSGIWETITEPVTKQENTNLAPEITPAKELVLVPESASRSARQKQNDNRRFPLLAERPGFSGGTMNFNVLENGRGELLGHLIRGTLFALLFAVVIFCLTPRIGRMDLWGFTIKFGHDQWIKPFRQPVGTVGFSEEIRLGSLGTVLPYHREVMSVQFMKLPDLRIPSTHDSDAEVPYDEILGATLYFRGIALDSYADGAWKPRKTLTPFLNQLLENNTDSQTIRLASFARFSGRPVRAGEGEKLFFEDACDLLSLHLVIQPLDTTVFFAPWPFFCRSESGIPPLRSFGDRVEERRVHREAVAITVYSTGFKHGTQLSIIPCQEQIDRDDLLQIPEQGLDTLKALAQKWDTESRFPKENFIARALYMERQFLESDYFKYKLGGTIRDYNLDPLEDFIEKNPSGHCEYFAGALALMLRSVGIGSRVIVGFKTHVVSPGVQVVRQSDAHAWVDVHLPPETISERAAGSYANWWAYGGWMRLDPSPAAGTTTIMKTVSFSLTDLNEWIQTMWGEFVLNMNSSKQTQWIYQPIRFAFHFIAYRVFNFVFWKNFIIETVQTYKTLFFSGVQWRWRDWGNILVFVVFFAFLFFLLLRCCQWLLSRLFRVSEKEWRRKATIDFYIRMERLLIRVGRERRPEETPLEFIRHSGFITETRPVVNAYYRVRFGAAELTDEELHEVREQLDLLEKKITEHEPA